MGFTLNKAEKDVLAELWLIHREHGEHYIGFQCIMDSTEYPRNIVRRACRRLARLGLSQYGKGLWTYDGEPAGAGYAITKEGVVFCQRAIAAVNKPDL